MLVGETLTRTVQKRIELGQDDPARLSDISPTTPWICAQDELEPILLAHNRRFPEADVRFNTELLSFQDDAAGVTAHLLDRLSGKTQQVRADYLIGADGASSRIGTLLGIPMAGHAGRHAQYSLPRCTAMVRQAVGIPDFPVEN